MRRPSRSPPPSLCPASGRRNVFLLAIALVTAGTSCQPNVGGSGDDSTVSLATIEGLVVDGLADQMPIGDAWVVVALGDTWVTTRTGADGSFAITDLPASRPVDLSVLAEGRVAVTYEGLIPEELSGVIVFDDNRYRDTSLYDFTTRDVTGTVDGFADGSYLIYYADPYWYGYAMPKADEPATFQFEVDVLPDTTDLYLSAVEYDPAGEVSVGAALGVRAIGDKTPFELTIDHDLSLVTVSVNRPAIGGVPAKHLGTGFCADLGFASPKMAWNAVTGWARNCDESGERFMGELYYLPSGMGDSLTSYVGNDDFTVWSGASLPVPDGADEVDIDLLDAALPDVTGDVTLGDTIGFEVDPDATNAYLTVNDDAGTTWYILNLDDAASSVRIPTFPDTLDTSALLTVGEWEIITTHYVYLADGTLDGNATHTYTLTTGGSLAW
jgi:hypothetical protein